MQNELKALSVRQPWAQAIVRGAKTVETRSWSTYYRGPLVIHAARFHDRRQILDLEKKSYWKAVFLPFREGVDWDRLEYGALLGVVDLIDCQPVENLANINTQRNWGNGYGAYTWTEDQLGIYHPGNYGWTLTNPRIFAQPIPYRGQQGLFHLDDTIARLITPGLEREPNVAKTS